jgi:hypothetical protein
MLHSKLKIQSVAEKCGILLPHTERFTGDTRLDVTSHGKLVKREYCRFGTDVYKELTPKTLHKINFDGIAKYLVQDTVSGTEYCTYSIIKNHKLLAFNIYKPVYRIRNASGIYFENHYDQGIHDFLTRFAENYPFEGQVGFDLIVNDEGIYLIDCNPRCTSGIHLLHDKNLAQCITNETPLSPDKTNHSATIKFMMTLSTLPAAIGKGTFRQWRQDMKKAREVVFARQDKGFFFYSLLSLFELIGRAIKHRISLRAASTRDIEWDGDRLK